MKRSRLDVPTSNSSQQTATILDWSQAFAARVMSRIHEYDDDWPKPVNTNTIVRFDGRAARMSGSRLRGADALPRPTIRDDSTNADSKADV
jgi:hypothetical protein